MARLTRSAARATVPATAEPPVLYPLLRELTPGSIEPSTDATPKLSGSTPARKKTDGASKILKSRMPVSAATAAAAAAQTVSYPSLEALDDKSLPKTPTGGDKTPSSPPPLTTARKLTKAPLAQQVSMPGTFGGGDASGFEFNFGAELGEYGRKILDEVREKAKDMCAQMDASNPITPPTNSSLASPTKTATTTTVKKNRFAEIHRAEFEKMPSIADHYAAKRKVVTPQNPQKGIKRTQSQATLDQKSLPPTPSPVKKLPEQTVERKSKRVKIEPVSSFASRISGISATPKRAPKSVSSARTAVARRVSNQKRPMPALPRESGIEPSVRLFPTSKIPVTPSARAFHNIAPATVAAAPKFSIPAPKSAAQAPGTAVKARAIKPLKKPAAPDSTKTPTVSSTHVGVLSPVKIIDKNLEDPFGSRDPPTSSSWGFQAPAGNPTMPVFPDVPTHVPGLPSKAGALLNGNQKRTGPDTDEDTDMTTAPIPSSPIRKKLRFEDDSIMEKGKSLLGKARLDFLATPKRKNDKRKDTRSAGKSGGKRPVWK